MRTSSFASSAIRVVLFFLMSAVATAATLQVDQQQTSVNLSIGPIAIGGASNQKLAQTVTAGVTGKLLRVDLPIGCSTGELVIEIQGIAFDGKPNGDVLSRRVFRGNSLPANTDDFKSFPLRRPVPLQAGDRFAIVMRNETGQCAISSGILGDPYPAGEFFFDDLVNNVGWIPNSDFDDSDLPFQTWMRVD